jgi:hypothetical protein
LSVTLAAFSFAHGGPRIEIIGEAEAAATPRRAR